VDIEKTERDPTTGKGERLGGVLIQEEERKKQVKK